MKLALVLVLALGSPVLAGPDPVKAVDHHVKLAAQLYAAHADEIKLASGVADDPAHTWSMRWLAAELSRPNASTAQRDQAFADHVARMKRLVRVVERTIATVSPSSRDMYDEMATRARYYVAEAEAWQALGKMQP
jgi:hypothetical protein